MSENQRNWQTDQATGIAVCHDQLGDGRRLVWEKITLGVEPKSRLVTRLSLAGGQSNILLFYDATGQPFQLSIYEDFVGRQNPREIICVPSLKTFTDDLTVLGNEDDLFKPCGLDSDQGVVIVDKQGYEHLGLEKIDHSYFLASSNSWIQPEWLVRPKSIPLKQMVLFSPASWRDSRIDARTVELTAQLLETIIASRIEPRFNEN